MVDIATYRQRIGGMPGLMSRIISRKIHKASYILVEKCPPLAKTILNLLCFTLMLFSVFWIREGGVQIILDIYKQFQNLPTEGLQKLEFPSHSEGKLGDQFQRFIHSRQSGKLYTTNTCAFAHGAFVSVSI